MGLIEAARHSAGRCQLEHIRPWSMAPIGASHEPPQAVLMSAAGPFGVADDVSMVIKAEAAILAGGCFWGMQDLLRRVPTVVSTRVGYTGGVMPNPTYESHGTHAEAIEIVFDPRLLSYRHVLEFFFQIHDPTTRNRQGSHSGTRYRSAIFYLSQAQRRTAEATIADLEASGLLPGKVVTAIEPAGPFWEAESEHQDYFERHPKQLACRHIRPGWRLPSLRA